MFRQNAIQLQDFFKDEAALKEFLSVMLPNGGTEVVKMILPCRQGEATATEEKFVYLIPHQLVMQEIGRRSAVSKDSTSWPKVETTGEECRILVTRDAYRDAAIQVLQKSLAAAD